MREVELEMKDENVCRSKAKTRDETNPSVTELAVIDLLIEM